MRRRAAPYPAARAVTRRPSPHSFEGNSKTNRNHFDAHVTKQDMLDTYLPAFHACVADANASSVMCSYNAVNGVPSCASEELLNVQLRQKWGFDGYITSDCGAVYDVHNSHLFTPNSNETIAAVLRAGMDSDCGDYLPKVFDDALLSGVVKLDDVKAALSHLVCPPPSCGRRPRPHLTT